MSLNDTLETLKRLAADAAQTAATKAKAAATITKTNIEIIAQAEKRKKAYTELGKLYYRDFITNEEPDDAEYLPLCDAITEASKAIDELREAIAEAKSSAKACAEKKEEAAAEDAADNPADLVIEVVDDVAEEAQEAVDEIKPEE